MEKRIKTIQGQRSIELLDGTQLTMQEVKNSTEGKWGLHDPEICLDAFWYNDGDIEFGPEIVFRSPEVLGEGNSISVTDVDQHRQPSSYFGRYFFRDPERKFPYRRCIDFTCKLDGTLDKVSPSFDLAFACEDNQAVTLEELSAIVWAMKYILKRTQGKAIREVVPWGSCGSASLTRS